MQFIIKKRDGPGRIGEVLINNKKILTPNIIFLDTLRFKPPCFGDIFITNKKNKIKNLSLKFTENILLKTNKKNNNYFIISSNENLKKLKEKSSKIFIIENASQLLDQPKKIVDFIIDLKKNIDYQKIIYLPSVGEPKNLALFTYLGIDFFDSTKAIIAARNNIIFFENYSCKIDDLIENPCICPACFKKNKKPSEMKFEDVLNHNYYNIYQEIRHVRNAIYQENLRNLVEYRVKTDPNLTAILRILDRNHYKFLEKKTPVISKGKIIATSVESLYRPEIKRFQERVISRFKKPKSAKILLLLPCSAKKPYSFSKSHKFFKERLMSTINPFIVHEVMITSPLGIVPRELELVYPASSYDIPVTGVWDEIEKNIIIKLLTQYLSLNKYEKIIMHLPKELTDFIKTIVKEPIITCKDNPISKKSLDNLYENLNKTIKNYEKIEPDERLKENIEALASYQFGKNIAKKLIKDCKIKGKYPYQKIMFGKTQIGMITKERGFISLTKDGAKKISNCNKYWVEIYSDFILKGSVFIPGIKDADEQLRIGDEVIVKRNKKIVAVGVAQIDGEEMKKIKHGEAVKIRHLI